MNRYNRALFVVSVFLCLSGFSYSIAREHFPKPLTYSQLERSDLIAKVSIIFFAGILFEASAGLIRHDIIDNLNKLKISRYKSNDL